jgi:heme/copper-type cytochrome/quinol oxidase subunit 2
VVHAVPEKEFTAWLAEAKTKFSDAGQSQPRQIAAAEVQH